MRKYLLMAAVLLSLGSLASAQSSAPNDEGSMPGNEGSTQRGDQKNPGKLKEGVTRMMLTDKSFVKKAAIANRAEVEMSNLAISKSQDPGVKSFAQRMVKDHTAATTELTSIAQSKNLEVPTELDRSHQSAVDKLSRLSGAEFDAAFSKQMKEDHDEAVALFTAAADDNSLDPQLKQFAQKVLPTLRDHQHNANDLNHGQHVGSAR